MISRKKEIDIIINHYKKELKEFNFCCNHYKKHNVNHKVDYYLLKIQETEKIIKYYTKEFNIKKSPLEEKIVDLIKSYGGEIHE